MKVLGTAGHVDHGKTRLVQALTGMNPDRLQEEQERQMTIDLGFAWLTLPDETSVGIIDVPGHRDFIENMLAGVGGIDAALFVVAADEGVMPQSREHLSILDLLEIKQAVVALTKIDLIEDESWIDLVREDVQQLLVETQLAGSPIVPVSAITGKGLEQLVEEIQTALQETPERPNIGRPRLPIDRAFTISGFGTVVTGTLVDGQFEVGEEVEVLPKGLRGRVRGLQTHKEKIQQAVPGSRVAINLSGIEVKEIERGDVVVAPQSYRATRLIDVHFRILEDAVSTIKHDARVKLYLGSAQRSARVRLLGTDLLKPGEKGWLQLVLEEPIVAARNDHFILRRPSPGATLGGGKVADPHPKRKHRRKDEEVLKRLDRLLEGTPGQLLSQVLLSLGPVQLHQAVALARLNEEQSEEAIKEISKLGGIVKLGEGELAPNEGTIVVERTIWQSLCGQVERYLKSYHVNNPLRKGMPREELKSRLKLEGRLFGATIATLVKEGVIVEEGIQIRLSEHHVVLQDTQHSKVQNLLERFSSSPYSPPSYKESLAAVGAELLAYLLDTDQLIQVSPDVVLEKKTYDEMVHLIREKLNEEETISVAQVRDQFDTSRKYALALMEHLDTIGVTKRVGDVRKLA
jgi:selenocysteine-specific elongation factor